MGHHARQVGGVQTESCRLGGGGGNPEPPPLAQGIDGAASAAPVQGKREPERATLASACIMEAPGVRPAWPGPGGPPLRVKVPPLGSVERMAWAEANVCPRTGCVLASKGGARALLQVLTAGKRENCLWDTVEQNFGENLCTLEK